MYSLLRTPHAINSYVMDNFAKGIETLSPYEQYPMYQTPIANYGTLPTPISYGILRGTGEIFKWCRDNGRDWWEIDRGYFHPGHFNGYYRISRQGMRARYDGAMAADLPASRLEAMGITMRPWRAGGDYVLVCPPTDAVSWFYDLPETWARRAAAAIRAKGHKVKIRWKEENAVALEDDLERAKAVYTFNSNVAVSALLAGVPVVAEAEDIKAWNGLTIDDIGTERMYAADRLSLFKWLSWCQFTLAEFRSGFAWQTSLQLQHYQQQSEDMMSDTIKVFMGFDEREPEAWDVAAHSIRRRSTLPVEVIPIDHRDLRKRGLFWRPWLIDATTGNYRDLLDERPFSTQFSHTRFLTPLLANYTGWALFMDCDMIFAGDIKKLFDLADNSKAAMVVKHEHKPKEETKMDDREQARYARKNWSSFVLFNCGHPSNAWLTAANVNATPGRDLHQFCWLKDHEIGSLPFEYNWIEGVSPAVERPEVIHYTLGGPWFRNNPECHNVAYADKWWKERDRFIADGGAAAHRLAYQKDFKGKPC